MNKSNCRHCGLEVVYGYAGVGFSDAHPACITAHNLSVIAEFMGGHNVRDALYRIRYDLPMIAENTRHMADRLKKIGVVWMDDTKTEDSGP